MGKSFLSHFDTDYQLIAIQKLFAFFDIFIDGSVMFHDENADFVKDKNKLTLLETFIKYKMTNLFQYVTKQKSNENKCKALALLLKIFSWNEVLSCFEANDRLVAIQKLFAFFVDKDKDYLSLFETFFFLVGLTNNFKNIKKKQ